jgi:hypothetical protein
LDLGERKGSNNDLGPKVVEKPNKNDEGDSVKLLTALEGPSGDIKLGGISIQVPLTGTANLPSPSEIIEDLFKRKSYYMEEDMNFLEMLIRNCKPILSDITRQIKDFNNVSKLVEFTEKVDFDITSI